MKIVVGLPQYSGHYTIKVHVPTDPDKSITLSVIIPGYIISAEVLLDTINAMKEVGWEFKALRVMNDVRNSFEGVALDFFPGGGVSGEDD